MKRIDLYIAKTILSTIALVTLMLAGLEVFMLFINQLDELGRADFNLPQALFFVLLQMPYQVYLFFPLASLLGCLLGLGFMAHHCELVVMRASGLSIAQIMLAVFKAAVVLILIVTSLGELIIPELSRFAWDQKMQALSKGQALRTQEGLWLKSQEDFIRIGHVLDTYKLSEVYQFRFNQANQLLFARKIEELNFSQDHWIAKTVTETQFSTDKTKALQIPQMDWDIFIPPSILAISRFSPDEMSLVELNQYLNLHPNALMYRVTYWQRLVQPFSTIVMMLLAIPFIFGPLRTSTMGAKFLAGASVGFSFHLLNRLFASLSYVMQWPALLAAIGPTVVFACLGLLLLRRAG